MRACTCNNVRTQIRNASNSGFGDMLNKYTFEAYEVKEKWQNIIKQGALLYTQQKELSWLYIGGMSGAGKSHICTAAATKILQQGKVVKYVLWRDIFHKGETYRFNEEQYNAFISELANVEVLVIDDFHYIEKVAINWAENGIKTPSQAKEFSYKYAKIVYTVMKALGKSTVPTDEEASYVHTWSKDLGFTDDIILEACKRSVRGTDKGRLQYADKILQEWKKSQVITLTDIEKLDKKYKESKTAETATKPTYKKSSFHQFEHRNYNFDAIEEQFLSN